MIEETQQPEYPYFVKIETADRSQTVPIAFLTPKQIQHFFQHDFKRLVEEAGAAGARVLVERATTADYEAVLREVAACLGSRGRKAVA
jgi:hypothetical protein